MHPYTTHQITKILHASLFPKEAVDTPVYHLVHDSRRIPEGPGGLFIALHGPRHDGHAFIQQAYEEGVRVFIVDQPLDPSDFPAASFISVKHTNEALQQLAAFHRQQFQIPVIGITGSNGKTTVKEWLFQLLHADYRIVRSPASYNSQVGVPLSVWQIQASDQLAIFEAGVSEKGEMRQLAPIINCNIGLFTNIGTAHNEGFSSLEEKIREKCQLFETAEIIIYCKDQRKVAAIIGSLSKKTFTWSQTKAADLFIQKVEAKQGWTLISGRFKEKNISIRIPFLDKASIENAIHCWAVLLHLGMKPETIAQRMQQLHSLSLRLALKQGIHQCTIIDDSYNADITSLANALDFLNQQPKDRKRTLILSDLLQSGELPEKLYEKIASLVKTAKVDRLIGIGEHIPLIAAHLPARMTRQFYPSTSELLNQNINELFNNEIILLKGARSFAFDRISNRLSTQQHRTVLEVNLEALSYNLRVFQAHLKPETKIMVMVKAAAYGSGSLEVARRLEYLGVDYLAVAYVDEGVRLRQGGVQLPVLVLNPEEASFETMLHYELEPEIYTLQQLQALQLSQIGTSKALKIHLKLDTGMNRLGFTRDQVENLAQYLKGQTQLKVLSIFTHLAASENPEEDTFSLGQITQFMAAYDQLTAALGYRPMRHVLNSSGIARFREHQMEMVRLGIGLYGILEGDLLPYPLQAVLSLKATISQIKNLETGQTIGYGRKGKAERPMRLATISIGYADGLPRQVGQRGYAVYIHGKKAPIVGNVCMDMCMVDVSHIPEAVEKEEVIIFGEHPSVQQLAKAADRIPYEILTGISARVKRVYVS